MPKPSSRPREHSETTRFQQSLAAQWLEPRALCPDDWTGLPRVVVKTPTGHPWLYRKRIAQVEAHARPGDWVEVRTPDDALLGYGLYNPRAEIAVRMIRLGTAPPDAAFWDDRLRRAVELRRGLLHLDEVADAYRVIHAEGDGLPGLVVDRLGDVLSAEVFSLAFYQRVDEILPRLAAELGTKHTLVRPGPQVHGQEGFLADERRSEQCPARVVIQEFGTRFRVEFDAAHKTGFFCDQRDNRRRLAELCRDRTVLDVCSYTGGFAVQAKRLGQAREVTAVELDAAPLQAARENANLNQVRVSCVQADAFAYLRDLGPGGRQFDVVVLDPPKFIRNRRELEEGTRKHLDLNRLAVQVVRPGGLFVTCCCAGLLSELEFGRVVHQAARQAGRALQLLAWTGASADHPVATNCPESAYLKAAWLRVE